MEQGVSKDHFHAVKDWLKYIFTRKMLRNRECKSKRLNIVRIEELTTDIQKYKDLI